jgi:hypothetical protein
MGTHEIIVDASSPAQIAKAIVTVNQTLGLRHIGLDALWKLYYAPNHTMTRAELEIRFGLLEDHFGLYCRRVGEELGANDPDALALVNSSQDEHGVVVLTLKPSVVTPIKSHAFSK